VIVGDIWLVRHGPVAVSGVCYGQSDVPLVSTPSVDAETIAARCESAGASFGEIWTSPWDRTRSVALPLSSKWRVACHVDARLSELHFGEWEGRTYDEIERRDGERFGRWMRNYETDAPPGGERVEDLMNRVAGWLAERRANDRTVLALTHGGVIRAARAVERRSAYSAVVAESVEHLVPERLAAP
jgi:alpha-ribazole phosphatase